jgi:hypothetical protein
MFNFNCNYTRQKTERCLHTVTMKAMVLSVWALLLVPSCVVGWSVALSPPARSLSAHAFRGTPLEAPTQRVADHRRRVVAWAGDDDSDEEAVLMAEVQQNIKTEIERVEKEIVAAQKKGDMDETLRLAGELVTLQDLSEGREGAQFQPAVMKKSPDG